jgi:transposase InsO family protein
LENLALRQQLAVLVAKNPRRRLSAHDRQFWIILRKLWSGWREALVIVQPETVVRWHRAGFKLYWRWISRKHGRPDRKPITKELRELIFRMVAENPTWGAPRIHGELKMLGYDISEQTVLRWMRKAPRDPEPAKRWAAFLSNRGANFNFDVIETIKSFGIAPKRTSFQCPWQNGVAERFVGNCRRDLLDHVIVLNERHLKRLMTDYVRYYHEDRTHLGLAKETPAGRKAEMPPNPDCRVISMPKLGGLHHRYRLAA